MQPQAVLLRADDTWYLKSVVAHFGESVRGGHFVSAFTTPPVDFTVAKDAVLSGPMPLADAWVALNSEPILLIYTNGRPPGP